MFISIMPPKKKTGNLPAPALMAASYRTTMCKMLNTGTGQPSPERLLGFAVRT
jgi:hypothetical protein